MSERKGRNTFRRFLKKLNNPPKWVGLIIGATALIALPLSILILTISHAYKVQAIIACVISGLIFIYAAIVTVNYLIHLRRKVLKVADRYEFTRNLHKDYAFRSIFFSACAFLCNLGYTVFLAALAFLYNSVWYGALAVYYIMLAASRGGILAQNNKHERKYKYDYHSLQKAKVGTYRYCGIMMLALTVALGVSVVELLLGGEPRTASGFVYVFAAVAVYKVVNAIVQFVRSSKRDDLAVRSVWYINLAVTLVSVLTLQTVILSAYPTSIDPAIFNGITGFLVCLITLGIGAFMIVHSVRIKKRLLAREIYVAEAVAVEESDGYNRDGYKEEK